MVRFLLLFAAVFLNIIGLNIGKWLQNAGGVGTYIPLLMLVGIGAYVWRTHGSATHFTASNMRPVWNWGTVNFWPQIAFAFSGARTLFDDERGSSRTSQDFPSRNLGLRSFDRDCVYRRYFRAACNSPRVFGDSHERRLPGHHCRAPQHLGIAFFGVIAAILVLFGNAGGVGTTVAGVARIPFVVGIDHYMPAAFGKIHPKWKTPWVSILVQAGISCVILLLIQMNETANTAYQILVDAGTILYFIPFLYMYAAAIKLSYRPDRNANPNAALIPGGRIGVWLVGLLGFAVVVGGIALSFIPPAEATNKWLFEAKLIGGTVGGVLLGLILYVRGARAKAREA